jgi:Ran GTPase-activating protein (RanGAP) involved in mRNA processing and transport
MNSKNVGVERLMEVFKGGKAVLEVLKFDEENEIGTRGAMALIANVKMFPNLKELYLDSNFFSNEVVEQLQEAFGDKLMEMENNGNKDDEEEDDEEDDDEEDEGDGYDDGDVDELAHHLESTTLATLSPDGNQQQNGACHNRGHVDLQPTIPNLPYS